jgi:hypothetical protein
MRWRIRHRYLSSLALCLFSVLAVACGGSQTPPPSPTAPTPAPAPLPPVIETIVKHVTGVTLQDGIPGQSVTLSRGPISNLRFNWQISNNLGAKFPRAMGTLLILNQEYLGSPDALAEAPGLVARSTGIENAEYLFEPSVTMQAGTTYWVFADAEGPVLATSFLPARDHYPGGDLYVAPGRGAFPNFVGSGSAAAATPSMPTSSFAARSASKHPV